MWLWDIHLNLCQCCRVHAQCCAARGCGIYGDIYVQLKWSFSFAIQPKLITTCICPLGVSLRQLVSDTEMCCKLSEPGRIEKIMLDVYTAISHLAKHHIVHCDIKRKYHMSFFIFVSLHTWHFILCPEINISGQSWHFSSHKVTMVISKKLVAQIFFFLFELGFPMRKYLGVCYSWDSQPLYAHGWTCNFFPGRLRPVSKLREVTEINAEGNISVQNTINILWAL